MPRSLPKLEKHTRYDLVKQTKRDNYRYLNETAARRGQTVLLGDSITEIFNWYELFEAYTRGNGQAVYNRGISGDTSDRLLERLEDNALNIAPRNLVLLIGTNDLGLGAPISFTARNVETIVRRAQESDPQMNLILQAVYPVNRRLGRDAVHMVGRRKNTDIRLLNVHLREIAERAGIRWLDQTVALSDERGELSAALCYDGLHLNAQGFTVAAQALLPLLRP